MASPNGQPPQISSIHNLSFRSRTATLGIVAPVSYHGVLHKYVNITTGYRTRYFVLQNGVLIYYKINNEHQKLSLVEHELATESYRSLIGDAVKVFDELGKSRLARRKSDGTPMMTPRPVVQGVMHLQVSKLRTSNADPTKFYITSAKTAMQLKAVSEADRAAWLAALEEHTAFIASLVHEIPRDPAFSPADAGAGAGPEELSEEVGSVAQAITRIVSEAAGAQVASVVGEHLQQLMAIYQRKLQVTKEKRKVLKARIRVLEEEKVTLEQELLSESRTAPADGHVQASGGSFSYGDTSRKRTVDAATAGAHWHIDDYGADAASPKGHPSSRLSGDLGERSERRAFGIGENGGGTMDEDEDETGGEDGSDLEEVASEADEEFFDCPDMDQAFMKSGPSGILQRGSLATIVGSVQDALDTAGGGGASSDANLAAAGDGGSADGGPLMHPPPWGQGPGRPAVLVRRRDIPPQKEKGQKASLWTIVKESVGKDLTRVCLPVYFNEPLGALQKFAEELEYSELLNLAACEPAASPGRHLLVAAFAVSGYACTYNRIYKPFNPLETETYEFVCYEKGFRMLSEKVSHHPTVMACTAEGRGWNLNMTQAARTKFKGRYIELTPLGRCSVRFHDGEAYSWNKVKTTINNIISGNLSLAHVGTMMVVNEKTQAACKVKFKEQGFLESAAHQLAGHLEIPGKGVVDELSGAWDTNFVVDARPGVPARTLWRRGPVLTSGAATRYQWNDYTVILNDITPDLEGVLPPTDSRLRPDQRMLEEGRFRESNEEKLRLEEKQRAARRNAESGKGVLRPRWFRVCPQTPASVPLDEAPFEYVGGYWEARAKGEWDNIPRIFD